MKYLGIGATNHYPSTPVTDAKEEELQILPNKFVLFQNYPNPFNPTTTIKYSIPSVETRHASSLHVLLKVYDILGNEVATLVNEEQPPGNYSVTFDVSHTEQGGSMASGIYFYKLNAGNFTQTKKFLLMK